MIEIASDILLVAGSLGLAVYCWILSRRLSRLSRSDEGLGATIAALAAQVETVQSTATQASGEAQAAAERLAAMIAEAETREGELSIILAGLSDLDDLNFAAAQAAEAGTAATPTFEPSPSSSPSATPTSSPPTTAVFSSSRRKLGGAP